MIVRLTLGGVVMAELDHTVLLAMGIIFLGAFVQSAIGFGLAIVAAPLLFLVSPDYVPAPIVMVALFNSLFNAYKYRNNIAIGGLKMAICLLVVCIDAALKIHHYYLLLSLLTS